MSQNLKSSDVFVFPCVNRTGDYELSAKLLNENNLSNIIKCVTDKKSFVINYDEVTHSMEFILNGYYFKLNVNDLTSNAAVYAYLSYKNTEDGNTQLSGDDNNDYFTGLKITDKLDEIEGEYLLLLADGEIPAESKVKFVLSKIDCGEVTIKK